MVTYAEISILNIPNCCYIIRYNMLQVIFYDTASGLPGVFWDYDYKKKKNTARCMERTVGL